MKPIVPTSQSVVGCAVRSFVAGQAVCRFRVADLPGLRQQPGLFRGVPLPPAFLKHADEQSVAGLATVSRAIANHELNNHDFSQWGVIAAPRFLGRNALAVALARFATEGAWGISPHLIPHRSLHALSGTVSQALKIHGPNYGVGGGADGAAEALLAAGALLADGEVPGMWVVLTGFDPELVPNNPTDTKPTSPSGDCVAVALALMPDREQRQGPFLSVGSSEYSDSRLNGLDLFSLEGFVNTLGNGTRLAKWRLRCGGWAAWEM